MAFTELPNWGTEKAGVNVVVRGESKLCALLKQFKNPLKSPTFWTFSYIFSSCPI